MFQRQKEIFRYHVAVVGSVTNSLVGFKDNLTDEYQTITRQNLLWTEKKGNAFYVLIK